MTLSSNKSSKTLKKKNSKMIRWLKSMVYIFYKVQNGNGIKEEDPELCFSTHEKADTKMRFM